MIDDLIRRYEEIGYSPKMNIKKYGETPYDPEIILEATRLKNIIECLLKKNNLYDFGRID